MSNFILKVFLCLLANLHWIKLAPKFKDLTATTAIFKDFQGACEPGTNKQALALEKPTTENKIDKKTRLTKSRSTGWGGRFQRLEHPYRAFSLTWPASMLIYWKKRKHLHETRVQLPEDFLGTPTWPPFHCFGTPIWPPWRPVKTLYIPLDRQENKRRLCSQGASRVNPLSHQQWPTSNFSQKQHCLIKQTGHEN